MIKKLISILLITVLIGGLVGCTTDNIGTPCSNFGSSCSKTPINSWNYND